MLVIRGRCGAASWAVTDKAAVSATAAAMRTRSWMPGVSLRCIARPFSIPDFRQQAFDLRLFDARNRQQRRASAASVVAVEVAGVFDTRNAQLAYDALTGAADALLLLFCKLKIVFLPGKIERKNPRVRKE